MKLESGMSLICIKDSAFKAVTKNSPNQWEEYTVKEQIGNHVSLEEFKGRKVWCLEYFLPKTNTVSNNLVINFLKSRKEEVSDERIVFTTNAKF